MRWGWNFFSTEKIPTVLDGICLERMEDFCMVIFVSLPYCLFGIVFYHEFFFSSCSCALDKVFKRQLFSIGKALDEEI